MLQIIGKSMVKHDIFLLQTYKKSKTFEKFQNSD